MGIKLLEIGVKTRNEVNNLQPFSTAIDKAQLKLYLKMNNCLIYLCSNGYKKLSSHSMQSWVCFDPYDCNYAISCSFEAKTHV